MIKIAELTLATVLILSGCGGGGGGESDSAPAAALPATTSVSGTAAKGIIKHAIVLAAES